MTLGDYIRSLVDQLAAADPVAAARLRAWVGRRRARISVDDETVEVVFDHAGRLLIDIGPTDRAVDGTGATDRTTVLDLLAGRLEATDAVLDGLIELDGEPDAVVAILAAIEILIDVSTRAPGLRSLADAYVQDRALPPARPPDGPVPLTRRTPWLPATLDAAEEQLLADLGFPGA